MTWCVFRSIPLNKLSKLSLFAVLIYEHSIHICKSIFWISYYSNFIYKIIGVTKSKIILPVIFLLNWCLLSTDPISLCNHKDSKKIHGLKSKYRYYNNYLKLWNSFSINLRIYYTYDLIRSQCCLFLHEGNSAIDVFSSYTKMGFCV